MHTKRRRGSDPNYASHWIKINTHKNTKNSIRKKNPKCEAAKDHYATDYLNCSYQLALVNFRIAMTFK